MIPSRLILRTIDLSPSTRDYVPICVHLCTYYTYVLYLVAYKCTYLHMYMNVINTMYVSIIRICTVCMYV